MKRITTYLTLILFSLLAVPQAYAWRHVSPYAYCAGDPVNNVDTDGKQVFIGFTNIPILGTSEPILISRTPVMASADKVVEIAKPTTKTGIETALKTVSKTEPKNATNGTETATNSEFGSNIAEALNKIDNKALNQARQMVRKGNAPKEIERIDKPNPNIPESQWHAHGNKGGINQDGSFKDGNPNFVKSTIKWLNEHGFNIPTE